MNWRTRGRERQGYSFTYDFLDRMTTASYYDINDAGTATASSRYNEALTYADHRGNIATLQRQGAQLSGACWNYAQIDNLTYTYTAGTNKISGITDAASATYKAKGFNPGAGTGSYVYDVNGNLTSDPYKAMTVQYNHLNLPKKMTFGNDYIEITYDAAGTKLRKVVGNNAVLTGGGGTEKSMNGKVGEDGKDGNAPEAAASAGPPTSYYTQDYLGGFEYRDGVREAIYTAEGRLYNNSGTNRYEYSIKDHLGNARISFTDKNGNNTIEYSNGEVLQENHYYPFGLAYEGPWVNDAARDNMYQYNGKEINDDFGLNWNDYGARWYDASVGRWWSVDPLADSYFSMSPYGYGANNPAIVIDPNGMELYLANNSYLSIAIQDIISLVNSAKFSGKVSLKLKDTEKGIKVTSSFGDLSDDAVKNDEGLSLLSDLTTSENDYLYEVNTTASSIDRTTGIESDCYKLGTPTQKGGLAVNLSTTDRGDQPKTDRRPVINAELKQNHDIQNGLPVGGFDAHVIISPSAGNATTQDGRKIGRAWFTFHELRESYNRTEKYGSYKTAHDDSKSRGSNFHLTPLGWSQTVTNPYAKTYKK